MIEMRKSLIIFAISLFFLFSSVSALTKVPVDVTTMSIEDLLNAMDKGYLTSEQLVNIYLERIETYDGMFNSINQLNDKAVEQAKKLDEERENGKLRGRLHGMPILVKCNIDVYGMPTTGGTKALKDNYPKENAFVVQKLVDEGAIILGSTNMSEMAFSAGNSYSSYGYVRNVFNTEYTSYGSSGGSAVAVAASFAAASLGTDTNSSVRIPAAGAGLVGVRPTLGLVSRSGVIPYDVERDTVGVLSRSVADNALLLNIISGIDEGDSKTANSKEMKIDVSKSSLEGVVIGVPTQYTKGSSKYSDVMGLTDPDIYNLVEASIKKLEEAGATLVYLDNFVKSSNLTLASQSMSGITMCDGFNNYIKGTTGTIRSFNDLANASGKVYDLSGYLGGCGGKLYNKANKDAMKATYRNYVDKYFEDYELDAILYPTIKNKVFGYKEKGSISPGSSLGSVIGYPSITVPMGFVEEFSYGVEFFTQAYKEETIYNVAAVFEKVNGNSINNSKLTPSLYEVPSEVTKLVNLYDSVVENESDSTIVKEWLVDTKDFLINYNDYDNEKIVAMDLIEKYEASVAKYLSNGKIKCFQYITIFMMIISFLIIYSELKRCFK
jgi:Asp-tRNA(Asn)/Glu-tRNA(Gln) amidotransferase A subunit family amidase